MKRVAWLFVFLALAILPAQAQISGNDSRYICVDGNVTHDAGNCSPLGAPCIDWVDKAPLPIGDGTLVGIRDGIGNSDGDILSPGPVLSAGSTLPKQDITRVWISNNTQYLYVAEERRANNGNSGWHLFFTQRQPIAVMGQPVIYELQNGDVQVRVCFPKGSDPAAGSIAVSQVSGVNGVARIEVDDIWASGVLKPTPGAVTAFSMNGAVVTALPDALDSKGSPVSTYDTACFAEAAISLSALGLDPCGSKAYVTVVTRSSCSLTSDVKDIAAPQYYSFGGPTVKLGSPVVDCSNNLTLSAEGSLGTPPYRFRWYDKIGEGAETLIRDVTLPGPAPVTDSLPTGSLLAPGSHVVRVLLDDYVSCPADDKTAAFTVYDVLGGTLTAGSATCGAFTWTAAATGGKVPYSYAWKLDGVVLPGQTGSTYAYGPSADCRDHTVCVTITDARGCTKALCKKVHQEVTTTFPAS